MSYVVIPRGATLDYSMNWFDAVPLGNTISASSWAVFPAGAGITVDAGSFSGLETQVKASASPTATIGVFLLENTVTFSNGVIDKRAASLRTSTSAEAI